MSMNVATKAALISGMNFILPVSILNGSPTAGTPWRKIPNLDAVLRMKPIFFSLFSLAFAATLPAAGTIPGDPFAPYLDGKPPEILREAKATKTPPEGVKLRRVVFHLRDDAEVL